jgi:hypothetical protein
MSDGEITVVVEGEDDEVADSATSRIEALNRQADADHAKAARLNLQTAHMRRGLAMSFSRSTARPRQQKPHIKRPESTAILTPKLPPRSA